MLGSNPVAGRHRRRHYVLLAAAALLLFFWNLGSATLWDVDEGRNSTCAYEMFMAGTWILPTLNGALRPDKPALLYWLQIMGYHVLGVNEWAARLPSAFAGLGTVLLVYELTRRMFSKSTALLAGIVLATSPMFVAASRFANPDALLSAFTTLTLYLFWRCQERPSSRWFALIGAAAGLAVLAKGPVGVVLPGAIAFVYLAWEGRLGMLLDRRLGWGVLTFLAVALPWYVMVGVETRGEFLRQFLWDHNVGRATATMEGHSGGPLYYPLALIAGTMPWSIFIGAVVVTTYWSCLRLPSEPVRPSSWWLAALTYPKRVIDDFLWRRLRPGAPGNLTWRRRHDPAGRGGTAAYRFLALWALAYLTFFSLSATKLPNYVLPATMPAAILTARLLDRWRRGFVESPAWYSRACLGTLALVGVGVGVGFAIAGRDVAGLMRGTPLPALTPFAWVGVVPIAGAILVARLASRGRRDAATLVFAVQAVLLLTPLAAWMTVAMNEYKSPASLARATGMSDHRTDLRIGSYATEHIPSLNFYTGRDVVRVDNEADLASFLRLPLPVYVVVAEDNLAEFRRTHAHLGRETARHFDMYRRQAMVVLTNNDDAARDR